MSSSTGGALATEILVDDKSVDSKNFTGTSVITGTSVYVFQ